MQSPYNPQTLNRYAYCGNNPINMVDPTGHKFKWGNIAKAAAVLVVGVALTIATGGAMAALGFAAEGFWTSVAVGAALGGTIGGTVSAAMGGDIGQGILTGAISGAIFGGIGSFNLSGWAQVGAHFAGGAVSGGINTAITGGNIGQGALISGLSAGVGAAAGNFIPGFTTEGNSPWAYTQNVVKRAVVGAITGGVASSATGGEFWQGARSGAITAAIAYTVNDFYHYSLAQAQGMAAQQRADTIVKDAQAAARTQMGTVLDGVEDGITAFQGGALALMLVPGGQVQGYVAYQALNVLGATVGYTNALITGSGAKAAWTTAQLAGGAIGYKTATYGLTGVQVSRANVAGDYAGGAIVDFASKQLGQ